MDTEKLQRKAYKVELGQGELILKILAEIEILMESSSETINTAAVLDLSRAMSNIGGRPA